MGDRSPTLDPGTTVAFVLDVKGSRRVGFKLYDPDRHADRRSALMLDPNVFQPIVIVAASESPIWRRSTPQDEHWYHALVSGKLHLVRFYDSDLRGYVTIIDDEG